MKPEHSFVAERAVAAHCEELLASRRPEVDPADLLAQFAPKLVDPLARALSRLGAIKPRVTIAAPRPASLEEIAASVGEPRMCWALKAGAKASQPVLAFVDAETVFGLLDRAFGGKGEAPDPMPDAFPLSAELFLARIEPVLVETLANALEIAEVQVAARHADPARASGLAKDTAMLLLDVTAELEDEGELSFAFALTPETVAALLDAPAPSPSDSGPTGAPATCEAVCMDAPLPLRATLVNMRMGVSRLSALKPGDVLPVSIARNVPLSVRGRVIAHGTVGEVDERVALQITQAF
jgi:flagellar motor switch protein FliM